MTLKRKKKLFFRIYSLLPHLYTPTRATAARCRSQCVCVCAFNNNWRHSSCVCRGLLHAPYSPYNAYIVPALFVLVSRIICMVDILNLYIYNTGFLIVLCVLYVIYRSCIYIYIYCSIKLRVCIMLPWLIMCKGCASLYIQSNSYVPRSFRPCQNDILLFINVYDVYVYLWFVNKILLWWCFDRHWIRIAFELDIRSYSKRFYLLLSFSLHLYPESTP